MLSPAGSRWPPRLNSALIEGLHLLLLSVLWRVLVRRTGIVLEVEWRDGVVLPVLRPVNVRARDNRVHGEVVEAGRDWRLAVSMVGRDVTIGSAVVVVGVVGWMVRSAAPTLLCRRRLSCS